jgi:hypothetical protein
MATKAKTGTGKLEIIPKKKRTRQGQGQNSLPNHGRKKLRGQGK